MKVFEKNKRKKIIIFLLLSLLLILLITILFFNKPAIGTFWISSCPNCNSSDLTFHSDSNMHSFVCTNCSTTQSSRHVGGYHENGGVCIECHFTYQQHRPSNILFNYETTSTTHTPLYRCAYADCPYFYREDSQEHTGGSHDNDGICTVCNLQYQAHSQSDIISNYNTTPTTHTPIYACSVAGCSHTYEGTSQNHTGATHENGGKCTVCNLQYQTHSQSNTISNYNTTPTTHTPIYACSVAGCSHTYEGTSQNHTGATHENGGKCTVCNLQYQTHSQSNTISNYNTTPTTHTPIYACSVAGCSHTYEGTSQNHTGATHENGGKCTVCNLQYQTHSQSNTISNYHTTPSAHTPIYACSVASCTHTYEGTSQNHTGATHENGGKCTVCNLQYQTHNQSNTISNYNTTPTAHTPIYACSVAGCSHTYMGTSTQHVFNSWTDTSNGTHSATCASCHYTLMEEHTYQNGKCTKCQAIEPTVSCEHTYTLKSNTTQHWQECSKCQMVKPNSLQVHTYTNYTDNLNGTHTSHCSQCNYTLTKEHVYQNGKCIDCLAVEPAIPCKHTYISKNNTTQHWQECSKCKVVKPNSLQAHTYTNYIDNLNGTHSSTCSECQYTLVQEHSYQNGECTNCHAIEPTIPCKHTYNSKNNATQHWQECSKCQTIKPNSLEVHSFTSYTDNLNGTHSATCSECGYQLTQKHPTDGTCKDCNSNNSNHNTEHTNQNSITKDNTTAAGTLPQTGTSSILMFGIFGLIMTLGIIVFKIKQYKDI
ncbi:MAG: LPXTG cell wall anchor domain-containing protein [Clostridia bacterium]